MGLKLPYEIRCGCGHVFTAELYEYVFAEYDEDLKGKILSGEFNCHNCPECQKKIYAETRFLYRDETNKLWVWVCREEERHLGEQVSNELMNNKGDIESHFIDNQENYKQHVVFGMDEFLALLANEDALRHTAMEE